MMHNSNLPGSLSSLRTDGSPGLERGQEYKPTFPLLQTLFAQRGLRLEGFGGLYTTRDVARIFGVCPRTVNRWCREGKLHPRKHLGRAKFLSEDLEAFLSAGEPS